MSTVLTTSGRFTFSRKFGDSPSETDYNVIRKDFNTYINSEKMGPDNVEGEAVRFRHLKQSQSIAKFKDCGNLIWSSTNTIMNGLSPSDSYEIYRNTSAEADNDCQILHNSPEGADDGDLLQYSFWYYPYSLSSTTRVAPGIRIKATGAWVALTSHERRLGVGIGFFNMFEQNPYRHNPDFRIHPYLYSSTTPNTGAGSTDRLGTVAYGGPVICTVTIPKSGISGYKLKEIDAFGMMVRVDKRVDAAHGNRMAACSVYDRLFLSLVSRDNY
mgnify:FL=1|tara:strand:- start:455 stop:1267 length:813 start_codon:yes stop_codon:yes gene_type:complete